MAGNFGVQIAPAADRIGGLRARVEFALFMIEDFDAMTRSGYPFVLAMNSLNRTKTPGTWIIRFDWPGHRQAGAYSCAGSTRAVGVTAGSG
nr:hypothetical protein [Bradyrhizobium australiense]